MLKVILFGVVDLSLLQSITGITMFSHGINGVCWFLSTLFICYLACPLGLIVVDKANQKKKIVKLLLLAIFCVIILSYSAAFVEDNVPLFDDIWYGHPIIRYWYLIIGMCIGSLISMENAKCNSLQEIGIATMAVVYFIIRNSIHIDRSVLRVVDILLVTLFLYVFSCGKGRLSYLLGSEQMICLGQKSMYLYLFHYPVRVVCQKVFAPLVMREEWMYIVESISIVVITCSMVYLYEKVIKRASKYFVNAS